MAQWKESVFTTADSVHLTYYTKGSGTPMLIIPGGPGYAASYLFSLADSLDKELAHHTKSPLHFTYIIPDLRGTGKSTIAPGDIDRKVNFDKVITDLEELKNKLGFEHWAVTGHSFGGLLAEYYAVTFPASVDHMVLLSSPDPVSYGWSSNIEGNAQIRLTKKELAQLDKLQLLMAKGNKMDSLKLQYDMVMLPAYIFNREQTNNVLAAMKTLAVNMQVFSKMAGDLFTKDKLIAAGLPKLKMPVLIMHGRMDPMGEGAAYENQKLLPEASLRLLGNTGHFCWIENSFATGLILYNFFMGRL